MIDERTDEWNDDVELPIEEEHGREPKLHDTAPRVERVILVGVSRPPSQHRFETDEHLEELEQLAWTAGADVVEKVFQNRARMVASTFIGSGKAKEIAERCEELDVQGVIFDDDLTPVQQRNLERIFNRKVIDRTTLILDIFALHARSAASRTQVELAQLEYLLPRLSGLWTHLSKQYGGIGTKGPGETQIETDRRILRDRIAHLRGRLQRIDRQRATQRKGRGELPRISLVGYTNVGKSTLLNLLTGAGVLAEDKLFATLDSTVRTLDLGTRQALISDTVGFIRKLPARLIASFKSTLDEVVEADIILHVADISHSHFREQIRVVEETLRDIGAEHKPVLMAFNKIDALGETGMMTGLRMEYPGAVFLSAARGINISELQASLLRMIEEGNRVRRFVIAPPDFRAAADLHRTARVIEEVYEHDRILVSCVIPPEAEQRILKTYAPLISLEP